MATLEDSKDEASKKVLTNGNRTTHKDDRNSVTRAAAKGTLVTLILRLISFGCTQLTIRALNPTTLGSNLELELLLTTVLFISREGFRLALTQNVVPENWTVGCASQSNSKLCIVQILSFISKVILHRSLFNCRWRGLRFL